MTPRTRHAITRHAAGSLLVLLVLGAMALGSWWTGGAS